MKKAIINNWILFFSIIILIILHYLTLFSVMPTEILWDVNILNSQELIIAETIIIIFLMTIAYLMRKALLSLKKARSRNMLKVILIILMFFSTLEILGAAIGMATEYKFINLSIYLFFLVDSIYCYSLVRKLRKHRKMPHYKLNKAQI